MELTLIRHCIRCDTTVGPLHRKSNRGIVFYYLCDRHNIEWEVRKAVEQSKGFEDWNEENEAYRRETS